MRRPLLALALITSTVLPSMALAQAVCSPPATLRPAPVERVPAHEVQRGVKTAYYLLALTWTPEFCRSRGHEPGQASQCRDGDFGFTLHGLWPNGPGKVHPRYCAQVGTIDPATVRQMFCKTPSPDLLQHEWQAHGSCGWNEPQAYFRQAGALYDRLVMPRLERIPSERITAGAVRHAFAKANRGLPTKAISIRVDGAQRLTEVRVCYDVSYRPQACPLGPGAPDHLRLRLTRSRSGGF